MRAAALPAVVRAHYVATPFGPMHDSCVHALEDGDSVRSETEVVHANGKVQKLTPCLYPLFTKKTSTVDARTPGPLANVYGWMANTEFAAGRNIPHLASDLTVPKDPAARDGQLLYFFSSIQNDPETIIVQPVLQWGMSPAGGGYYWAYASWLVSNSVGAMHSKLIATKTGHVLHGSIMGSNCAGNVCRHYNVSTTDVNAKLTSSFSHEMGLLFTADKMQGAVFEAYGLSNCADFPQSAAEFHSIHGWYFGGAQAVPNWYVERNQGVCGLSVHVKEYDQAIHYNGI